MEQKLRKTGIEIIGDARWGTHFCQFYQTKEDLIDILVPYFKAGLENNEYCMWVTSKPLKLEEAKAALRKKVKNLDNYIKKGQIEILDYSNWYIKSGRFESDKVLEGWVKKEKEALKRGFEGLRLTGNTFWLEKRDWKSFADYEAVVDSVIGGYRMLAICSYSLDKCKGGEIIDVLSNHQFALIRQAGKWKIIESFSRKKIKEGLQVTTSILQNIISNIPYYVFWKDKNSVYLGCNDNFAKLAGVEKPEAIIGKTDYDLPWKKEESDLYRKIDKEVMSKVTPILNIEESAHRTDGKVTTILTSKVPLRNAYGEVTGILGIFTDITERKHAEEKLQIERDKLQIIMDIINGGVTIQDREYNIIYQNKFLKDRFGGLGSKCYRVYEGKEEVCEGCPVEKAIIDGKSHKAERKVIMPGGEFAYWENTASLIKGAKGEFVAVVELTIDITERKQAEVKLKQTAEEWRTTFDSIADMVSIHDKDFKIVRANRSFASVFKMKPGEIIGKTCYELIHGTKEPPPFCPHKRTLDTGKPNSTEFFDPHLGIYIEASTSPLFDENGQVIASVHIAKDITKRKQAEAELKAAQKKLIDTAHRAGMSEVAADVLHNVGNVLNSINVSTTVIREKVTSSELAGLEKVAGIINEHTDDLGTFLTEHPQGKHIPVYLTEVSKCLQDEQTDIISRLKVLADNVQHIKDIVNMQQSYAKVSGVEVQTSLSKLVEDAIQINSAGLERHGTRLIREFEELGDVEIDKQKVLQILVNLISNAKYALSGSNKEEKLLTIRIYKHNEDCFRIEVADNGVGIPKDNLTKIFSHGFTTKKDGHGFGLHSCALASKEIGGSLTVYSDGVGRGSTFTLELPFKPIEVMK